MADFTKRILSGSTNGKNIKVAASSTPGTTIHTAVSGTSSIDEIHLWACNTDSSDRVLTLEWGGTTAPDDNLKFTVPAGETIFVAPGWPLQNGLLVKAFAATANVITIIGHVNRIA